MNTRKRWTLQHLRPIQEALPALSKKNSNSHTLTGSREAELPGGIGPPQKAKYR